MSKHVSHLIRKAMKRTFLAGILLSFLLSACIQEKQSFEKILTFPDRVTSEQKVKLAAYVVPTPQQYDWQQLELTAFIHFGMNTFTGREWGDGKEDPALFNPTDFNAEQWVTALKDAGFKMLILTAKHHDGFCLWPTKTTSHSVASSPWRDGNGDVVKEVKAACDKYGMKFGVYLSPWDRNAESYGDSPRYNEMFVQQLTELLSDYGEINEVWFDGANGEGPNGKVQQYDWRAFYKVIEKLQPKAVKAIMGNDIRWVGNESGLGRETEWSVTPLNPDVSGVVIQQNKQLDISPTSKDLGSRELIAEAKTVYWYPSEVDVSIRPGWFYHPEQDHQVKTLQQLVDIYFKSVGMNSVLLLNVPPDTRGQIHEIDVERLAQFGTYITNSFNNNKLLNGNVLWTAKPGASKEYGINAGDTVNTIMLQEDIRQGQRVESFSVEGLINDKWEKLTGGTTIGYKRLLKFDNAAPSKIKITIQDARAKANISNVGAFYVPVIKDTLKVTRLNDVDKNAWTSTKKNPLIVDMGEKITVKGFTYAPDSTKESVFTYVFRLSDDEKNWITAKKGEFGNIKNNPVVQTVYFDNEVSGRYFQMETLSGVDGGKPTVEMSQIGILTK